ncbi:MAG: CheR family methyltransferase [Flavisolibacter sp.]
MPGNSGMAYILVQHLSPQYESILPEILQKSTLLPVIEITDNIKVYPDHIYVIPSNKILIANDGVLELEPRVKGERLNSIDIFFTSLAEIHQEHAIGVVLSGTGSDGTIGLKTIKDHGGITVAQDEASAAYNDMPKSAIDAEVVDFVLPPEEIPQHLLEVVRSSQSPDSDVSSAEEIKEDATFIQIIALLKAKHKIDFTYYKQTTIRRRILRRKALNKIEKLKEYFTFLLENKSEQEALVKDILIPVTAFFRDPQTFEFLCNSVFPKLFHNKSDAEPIRMWVAGCATGEEAYSLAICLNEYFGENITNKKIQIFATDISEHVIAKARSGIYLKKDMVGVSESRIKEFFTRTDGSYQLNKEIRQLCVFACQNFLKDPPFARMDLISCRNVLIYMEPYLQKKALSTFHYALNSKGFLLLGKSESPGQSSEQFQAFNDSEKIYTRKATTSKYMLAASQRSETAFKRNDDLLKTGDLLKDDFGKAADEALLTMYSPVGVIVNENAEILQFRGITSAYLEAPPGKASHNILTMARSGLAFELRNALHKAKTSNSAVKKEGIPLDKGTRNVDIDIIPLHNTIDKYFLVLFKESKEEVSGTTKKENKKIAKAEGKKSSEVQLIEHLEKELLQAREDMRSITEDQEAANEELQSANEELLSGSEELQSLNEELETTKEEIQSTNEELTSLNQELIERNEQLNYSRKYAEAIVSTIHDSLLILTKDFQIKSANKCFYSKFETTEKQTEGQMFFEWGGGVWNFPGLKENMEKILPDQSSFGKFEVSMTLPPKGHRSLLINAHHIINDNSNEQLILVAIQDITDQKAFEQALELQVNNRTRELREANLHLQHSNENLLQFASIASHDLQEPLRKIKTFATLLDHRFENVPEEANKLIKKINRSTDRMSQLIKEVLEYSKLANAAKGYVQTNLDTILKNVLDDLDLLLSENKVVIDYREALPSIDAIPLQMNQLFYNLLTNAIKFQTSTSHPVIAISFRWLSENDLLQYAELKTDLPYLEIRFSDNGIGFDQEFAGQIFQLFERLHNSEDYEGTGLGLALCKKIVENHNGKIFAISKEAEGASFYIILPGTQIKDSNKLYTV